MAGTVTSSPSGLRGAETEQRLGIYEFAGSRIKHLKNRLLTEAPAFKSAALQAFFGYHLQRKQ